MKIRRWLTTATTALALIAVAPTDPAAATGPAATTRPAATGVQPHAVGSAVNVQDLFGLHIAFYPAEYPVEVIFDATDASGRSLCLDAADGQDPSTAPEADVWGCGANPSLLTWQLEFGSLTSSTTFYLRNTNRGGGCLDYVSSFLNDNGPVVIWGPHPKNSCAGTELWSLYWAADDDHMYLAPAVGGFPGYVVSPAGTHPGDGADVHLWHTNGLNPVNVSQYVTMLCLNTCSPS